MTRPLSDLRELMSGLSPRLDPRRFVFVAARDADESLRAAAIMAFREAEGLTLILEEAEADGLDAAFPCRMITLDVHSALDAVGFLAAILPTLAAAGIGVNPVSACRHDHLFVPADRAEDALEILRALAEAPTTA